MTLKRLFYILLPVLVVVVLGFFAVFLVFMNKRTEAEFIKTETLRVESSLQEVISSHTRVNTYVLDDILQDPNVVQLFYNKDREHLYQYLLGKYNMLKKDLSIDVLAFQNPDLHVFLRMQDPRTFGDDLSKRSMLVEVNKTKKLLSGIELGRSGIAIRTLQPVFYNGQFIGTAEVGMTFTALLNLLQGENILFVPRNYDGETINQYQVEKENFSNMFTQEDISKVFSGKIQNVGYVKNNYLYTALPVKDYAGSIVGVLMTRTDASTLVGIFRSNQTMLYSITITLIIALVIFFLLLGTVILKRISTIEGIGTKLAANDLVINNRLSSKDELGRLFTSFFTSVGNLKQVLNDLMNTLRENVVTTRSLKRSFDANDEELRLLSKKIDDAREHAEIVTSNMEEINSEVEEIKEGSELVANNAQSVSLIVNDLENKIESSKDYIAHVNNSMDDLANVSKEFLSTIGELSNRANNIVEIVNTINSITEQINLLALNAAIEAARAGEAGRGFAVVADEIRKLAEESRHATNSISSILNNIKESIVDVDEKSKAINENVIASKDSIKYVSEQIEEIEKEARQVSQKTNDFLAVSEEQSASTSSISEATMSSVESIEKIAQMLTDINAGMEHMQGVFEELLKKVDEIGSKALDEYIKANKTFKLSSREDQVKILAQAKEDHKRYVDNLKKLIDGDTSISLETDPHFCRFGISYYSYAPESFYAKEWQEIEPLHDKVHSLAEKVIEAVEKKDMMRAREFYKQIENYKDQLIKLFDTIIDKINQEKSDQ